MTTHTYLLKYISAKTKGIHYEFFNCNLNNRTIHVASDFFAKYPHFSFLSLELIEPTNPMISIMSEPETYFDTYVQQYLSLCNRAIAFALDVNALLEKNISDPDYIERLDALRKLKLSKEFHEFNASSLLTTEINLLKLEKELQKNPN